MDLFLLHIHFVDIVNLHLSEGYSDGLMQDCSNSIANTLELLQSCAKPSNVAIYCSQQNHDAQIIIYLQTSNIRDAS